MKVLKGNRRHKIIWYLLNICLAMAILAVMSYNFYIKSKEVSMICPYCKEENSDGAIICKHCKSKLTQNDSLQSPIVPINTPPSENSLDCGGFDLYYASNIPFKKVEELGDYLKKNNVIRNGAKAQKVKIEKNESGYILKIQMEENVKKIGLALASELSNVSEILREDIFNWEKVIIHCCQDNFEVFKVISSDE